MKSFERSVHLASIQSIYLSPYAPLLSSSGLQSDDFFTVEESMKSQNAV